MVDFTTLAAVKVEDLPEPKKLPMGAYIWSVDRVPEQNLSKAGNGTNVAFRLKLIAPTEPFDGDEEALEEFGNPAGTIRTKLFYIPNEAKDGEDEGTFANRQAGAVQRLRNFLALHLRVEGETLQEMLSNSLNYQCIGIIKHVPPREGTDKSKLVEDFGDTAPLDD